MKSKVIKVESFGDYCYHPVETFEEVTEWIRKHPDIHILNALFFSDEGTYMNIYYEEES